jgi:spermidine synthase
VGLVPIFWFSFLLLAPLGLVDGAMFAFGVRAYAHLTGEEAPSAGRVYVYEAVGALVGGLVFTYLFISFLHSLQIVLVLVALNTLAAGLIVAWPREAGFRRGRPLFWIAPIVLLLVASVGLLFSPLGERLQRWATGRQWQGYDLVYSENSVYGNVAVVQRESQYTFYADGLPILTAPVPDVAAIEEIVHLPLLFVPQPRRALVLSGGVGGVLNELNKYPLDVIDYAELDPLLIEAVEQFPTALTRSELDDARVRVENVDGRLLVRRTAWESVAVAQQPYDLILVNLPYPSTLQLNRFYTVEFFRMARQLLAEEGVLVVGAPGSLSYLSDELRNLNAVVLETLQEAFPHVRPIPGDRTLWLASPAEAVTTVPVEALAERWEARDLEAQLITPAHIGLRLDPQYLAWFWASLGVGEVAGLPSPAGDGARVNQDLHPRGLFYGLSYWNALFSPRLARFYAAVGQLRLWHLGLLLLAGVVIFLLVARARGHGAVVPLAIAATGFTGMTADLILIFAFQSIYGYVYHWIGLLIAAFMAGAALGGWLMTRWLSRIRSDKRAMLALEGALVLFWVLLPLGLTVLYSRAASPLAFRAIQPLLFLLNALAGLLVGAQFPLANRTWQRGRGDEKGTAGVLYAADLVGAFVGAILVSVVFLPVLGIVGTCLLAAMLKVGSLVLVAALPREGRAVSEFSV